MGKLKDLAIEVEEMFYQGFDAYKISAITGLSYDQVFDVLYGGECLYDENLNG